MSGLKEHAAPTDADCWSHLVWIGAMCLLVAAIFLGLVLGGAPYAQMKALSSIVYHDEGFSHLTLALTPTRYAGLRGIVAAAAFLGAGLLVGLQQAGHQMALLRVEMRHAAGRLTRRWRCLPLTDKLLATGTVAALVAVRGWYVLNYPLGTDEIASYDYFVREGPVAISSFYPIPNNHIFYNFLSWPLAEIGLSPRWVMRLPTLVLGTAGTVVGYGLLARLTGLRLATLVTGLVGLVPIWVYYAAVGRGYFVQFCLLQVGFFAALELLRTSSAYWRLSWLGLVGSSILGLYTIPTYAYPLVSLLVGLGGTWLVQRQWSRLSQLVAATATILLVVLLLYAPVMAVSGWKMLVANRYVATRTAAQFWPTYRAVLYETAAGLFGPSLRISGPAWLAAALLGAAAVRRWVPAGPQRALGFLAWAMVVLPLLLMPLQRVYAPLRTILYVTYFGYLLSALLLQQLPLRRWVPGRLRWGFVFLIIIPIGSIRLYWHQAQVRASRHETQQLEQAYHWLATQPQPAGRPLQVWLHAPLHELFFAHYSHQAEAPRLLLRSGTKAGPDKPYDFAVLDNYFVKADTVIQASYHRVYHDDLITIYAVGH